MSSEEENEGEVDYDSDDSTVCFTVKVIKNKCIILFCFRMKKQFVPYVLS